MEVQTVRLPSLEEIHRMTDVDQIQRVLQSVLSREIELQKELEDSLVESEGAETNLDILETLP